MTPEQKSSQAVRLHASRLGLRLFRNNSGVLFNEVGIPVRFGLGNESKKLNKKFKSGDYIGITPITITQEMVGKTVGIFTNLEIKSTGFKLKNKYNEKSREFGQQNFNNLIIQYGGLAGFATNENDLNQLLSELFERLQS